jgi:hypothetical protein
MCLRDIMVMAEGSIELLTFEARKYARAIVRDFSDDTFGAELEDGVEFRSKSDFAKSGLTAATSGLMGL